MIILNEIKEQYDHWDIDGSEVVLYDEHNEELDRLNLDELVEQYLDSL